MGKFDTSCCTGKTADAESSGTLFGGSFTVPALARSVTLIQHSNGSINVTGEVNATFQWAGSSRSWNATETGGTDGVYLQPFVFDAPNSSTVWEVNYQI